ncbi:MAG: hypothetical protein S4CHLAM102_04330 [Chlamydiia bacterium]|nr:hypothetical protein [Chlamydiia bacterium]
MSEGVGGEGERGGLGVEAGVFWSDAIDHATDGAEFLCEEGDHSAILLVWNGAEDESLGGNCGRCQIFAPFARLKITHCVKSCTT